MGKADLHIHSSASDGRYPPEEIVRRAAALGLAAIAIADHDTVEGIAPALQAARAFPRLTVIPGVEISTDARGGEVHVLGCFIDYTGDELLARLERSRNSRKTRSRRMIDRLKELGMDIEWQRVQDIAGDGAIGRPHIARAMLEKGYVLSLREAFDRYIGYGKPAYVQREKMPPAEAVRLITQAGGLAVLAHPLTAAEPEATVAHLKAAGLVALEAYYNGYSSDQTESLVSLAGRYGLITTGGSDYHGLDDSQETMMGGIEIPDSSVDRLFSLAEHRAAGMV